MTVTAADIADACRSCGAPILWGATGNDKVMPIDEYPHRDGNVRVAPGVRSTSRGTFRAVEVLGPLEVEVETDPLYRSHFATCPDADRWRRR